MKTCGYFKLPILILAMALYCLGCRCAEPILNETVVYSPDQKTKLLFSLKEGKAFYQINRNDRAFVDVSAMGIKAKELNLDSSFELKEVVFNSKDDAWTQPWGENKDMRECYNEMAVSLTNSDVAWVIRFRLFDDGLGFRYEYQALHADSIFVTDELTEFAIADDGTAWAIAANGDSYEYLYGKNPISRTAEANTPMTFKTNAKVYGSIHEAALYDFPEMTLRNAGGTKFKATLDSWPDGIKAKKESRFSTSWRTIQIGDKAIDLINSSLILNLNEPCKLETTDWIEPMKYIGVWWGIHVGIQTWEEGPRHGATTVRAKEYIDFAHDNNIRGVLFEGWNKGWDGSVPSDMTPQSYFDLKKLPGNGQWFDGASEYKIANRYKNVRRFNIELSLNPAANYTHYITPNDEHLFIEGDAIENGSVELQAREDGIFEFIGGFKEGSFKIKGVDGNQICYYAFDRGNLIEKEESVTLKGELRPYYLLIDLIQKKYTYLPIKEVTLYRSVEGRDDRAVIFNYTGDQNFHGIGQNLEIPLRDYGRDDRYKFLIRLSNGTQIEYGHLKENAGINVTNETGPEYFKLYPAADNDVYHNVYTWNRDIFGENGDRVKNIEMSLCFKKDNYHHSYKEYKGTDIQNEPDQETALPNVYPTLFDDHLTVQAVQAGFSVKIYSLTGICVWSGTTQENIMQIERLSLSKGMYLVRVVQGLAVTTRQIIKL